ncbi:MAG TPA: hypothetical protein VFU45_08200 [Gemmatimonadales bacterium]|nr:hypothetical protein [Gemmatimonadales bacterium]
MRTHSMTIRLAGLAALAAFTSAPLQAQDVMAGTRWNVHQQDRDSGVTWVFLEGGTLRVIAGGDSTSTDRWRWTDDSLEITLAHGGTFVGALAGQRLAGTRDVGRPTEGWWYADQVGGPSVVPEEFAEATPSTDSVPADTAAAPQVQRRRGGMMRRRGQAGGGASGGAGIRFGGLWAGGARLMIQFTLDGGARYVWQPSGGEPVRGQGTWRRVQRQVVVRIKDASGADLVLRGEVTPRGFLGQATLPGGGTSEVILRRAPMRGTGRARSATD